MFQSKVYRSGHKKDKVVCSRKWPAPLCAFLLLERIMPLGMPLVVDTARRCATLAPAKDDGPFPVAMTNPYYTWLGRGIVFPMQGAAIIGANVVAGGMYAFRALVRREV